MDCNIPKDLIEVCLSYREITRFDHCGNIFKKGNTDFTLVLQPIKDDVIEFTENFKLVLIDGETNYEIPVEYYTYDGTVIQLLITDF